MSLFLRLFCTKYFICSSFPMSMFLMAGNCFRDMEAFKKNQERASLEWAVSTVLEATHTSQLTHVCMFWFVLLFYLSFCV